MLFADQTAKLVAGHVHTVEVHQAVVSLNILNTQLNLSVCQGLVLVQVSKTELKHSSFQAIRGNLGTLCLGNESLPCVLDGKDGRSNQFVPLFLQEGVDGLLAASLLTLRESLVLSLLSKASNKRKKTVRKYALVNLEATTTQGRANLCFWISPLLANLKASFYNRKTRRVHVG